VGDISQSEIGNLPSNLTASNFGKMSEQASKEDITKGILNMVFQVIGMMSIFAARQHGDKNIVLSGKLVNAPLAGKILDSLSRLYKVKFHIPKHAEYCTAIGAAISASPSDYGVKPVKKGETSRFNTHKLAIFFKKNTKILPRFFFVPLSGLLLTKALITMLINAN
jgi:pantothenate kinase